RCSDICNGLPTGPLRIADFGIRQRSATLNIRIWRSRSLQAWRHSTNTRETQSIGMLPWRPSNHKLNNREPWTAYRVSANTLGDHSAFSGTFQRAFPGSVSVKSVSYIDELSTEPSPNVHSCCGRVTCPHPGGAHKTDDRDDATV